MPPPGRKVARGRTQKRISRAGGSEKLKKSRRPTEPPKLGWALSEEGLAALLPIDRRRHLLFGDLLDDAGGTASIFPHDSVEIPYRMPDPRSWIPAFQLPADRQDRLLGVLKAAEARSRVRALRLRYTRMRVGRGKGTRGVLERGSTLRAGGADGQSPLERSQVAL